MSQSQTPVLDRVLATMREARELVASVNRRMEEDDALMRRLGLDPAQVFRADPSRLSPMDRRKLEEIAQRDRDEIEDAARQVSAQGLPEPAPSKSRRRHDMV